MTKTSQQAQTGSPLGRRPGESATRQDLLEAAKKLFAQTGYDGASLRKIAAAAGVDPGMIRHYFGDKETLFVAAMTEDTEIPERLGAALAGPPETVGERITDTYLRMWQEPDTRPILEGLVRSAMNSTKGAALLSQVLTGRVHNSADLPISGATRERGLLLAASHLFGVAVARSVLGVRPLVETPHDKLVEAVSPAIQRYLTGEF